MPAPASRLARNYAPLPVTVVRAEGAWVEDADGARYLDLLAGYSALNFGHRHPDLVAAARAQLGRSTLVSRAFDHDLLEPFAAAATDLTSTEMLLPMNTGAEAVESAIKVARRWGAQVRGVPAERATIVVADGNFHGRTTTIVSFSTDPDAREGYGPYTPGFRHVPFGDAEELADAVDDDTVAVLLEPVQGEAGVVVPPAGYLRAARSITEEAGALLVLDEIQSGLGRTGATLAQDLEGVRADLTTLGKALGGGIVPVSAVVGRADVLGVLTPGSHGSTFGGNPLACAVGIAVCELLADGTIQARATRLGELLGARLDALVADGLLARARRIGLWAGIDLPGGLTVDGRRADGHDLCVALARRGVLAKDTHGATVRLSPPLTIDEADLEAALDALRAALVELAA
ncbi:ornithine--oxo-acid transaminase [Georgenia sp. Z1344]|uniref:ornithine--oxo-acid transaminase n=1 Tax=Georgenia sp. Z1344 TaxID=3416706 RepID=UPI003CF13FF7